MFLCDFFINYQNIAPCLWVYILVLLCVNLCYLFIHIISCLLHVLVNTQIYLPWNSSPSFSLSKGRRLISLHDTESSGNRLHASSTFCVCVHVDVVGNVALSGSSCLDWVFSFRIVFFISFIFLSIIIIYSSIVSLSFALNSINFFFFQTVRWKWI